MKGNPKIGAKGNHLLTDSLSPLIIVCTLTQTPDIIVSLHLDSLTLSILTPVPQVVTLLILTLPGFPPHTEFTAVQFSPAPPWDGPLAPNEKLNLVDKLFENKLKGPESFATRVGFIYTGLMNGLIVKIDPEDLSIEPVARIGKDYNHESHDVCCIVSRQKVPSTH